MWRTALLPYFVSFSDWGVGVLERSTQTPEEGVPGAGVTGCVWDLPWGTLKEQYTLSH